MSSSGICVSMLKRYHGDKNYIIKWDLILLEKDLIFEAELIAIIDRDVRKLRNNDIKFVKVQWKHLQVKEYTWETEMGIQDKYFQWFIDLGTTSSLF